MRSKTVTVQIHHEGSMCFIPVPFDPKEVFGKTRAPVSVTLNGYTYRSTIFSMHGLVGIPLRQSHREAAGIDTRRKIAVKIALDTRLRTVTPPPDLKKALAGSAPLREAWEALSYTYRREHAEALTSAKKPETRERRLAAILSSLRRKKAK
jgi:bacteriocin resistance YdeI/OmpD-like protein/uncharacterized protein DUF1905